MGFDLTNMSEKNISRAALESAIYGLKLGLDAFDALGYEAREIRLIGGGAKSPVWRQMVADVCNLPVVVPKIGEAAAFGGALQAYWCLLGRRASIADIVWDVELERDRLSPIEENVKGMLRHTKISNICSLSKSFS